MKTALGYMGPAQTPQIVGRLIKATCIATILTALIDPFVFGFNQFGLQYYLSLSSAVFRTYFLWQPLTYLFVLQPFGGISFGLIISLVFQMFILWMMGSGVAERYGEKSFAKLYFATGILSALLTLPYYAAYPFAAPLAGPTASLFAVFVVWAMLHQHSQILLFFIIPIKAKWLLAGGVGAAFLVFVSQGSLLSLILLLTGVLCGYFYAVFFKQLSFPFPIFTPIDRFFFKLKKSLKRSKTTKGPKIVNFPNGKPVETDEEFVDRMLEKISKRGRGSLTKDEQERLDKISKRK